MRQVIYSAAASLDGFIARADGAVDWIPMDPDVDFAALFGRFDTILMGRKTFDVSRAMLAGGAPNPFAGLTSYVFSRTEAPGKRDGVEFYNGDPADLVRDIRQHPGKDLWLMGGGELAKSFLEADLVDGLSIAICPVLLGAGVPMFGPGFPQRNFRLVGERVYRTSGIVSLDYERFSSLP